MKNYSLITLSLMAVGVSACTTSDDEPSSALMGATPAISDAMRDESALGTQGDGDHDMEQPLQTACPTQPGPSSTIEAVQTFVDALTLTHPHDQRCASDRLWASEAQFISASRESEGRDENSDHLEALADSSFRITSGITAHHGGTRFSWATDSGEGMALALLNDDYRFTNLILFSGEKTTQSEVSPYFPYLAAWNEGPEDDRRSQLEEVWPAQAVYIDPTADVTGPAPLMGVIDAYIRGFDGRAIVVEEIGQKTGDWFWITWTIRDLANENDLVVGMDFCQVDEQEEKLLYLFSFFGELPAVGVGGNEGDCLPCFPAKMSGAPPSELCTSGSPTSVQVSQALGACVCSAACPSECGDTLCMGMAPSDACFECIESHGHLLESCPTQIDACWSDG